MRWFTNQIWVFQSNVYQVQMIYLLKRIHYICIKMCVSFYLFMEKSIPNGNVLQFYCMGSTKGSRSWVYNRRNRKQRSPKIPGHFQDINDFAWGKGMWNQASRLISCIKPDLESLMLRCWKSDPFCIFFLVFSIGNTVNTDWHYEASADWTSLPLLSAGAHGVRVSISLWHPSDEHAEAALTNFHDQ